LGRASPPGQSEVGHVQKYDENQDYSPEHKDGPAGSSRGVPGSRFLQFVQNPTERRANDDELHRDPEVDHLVDARPNAAVKRDNNQLSN